MNNYYLNRRKDSPEEIKAKGSRLYARVTDIKKTLRGYVVHCVVEHDELYEGREYISPPSKEKPKVGIGSNVDLYIDDADADGEYYIDIQ